MNTDVIEKLRLAGFKPTDLTLNTKDKQRMICLLCGNEEILTPNGKLGNFKKYPTTGCKQCTIKNRYKDSRSKHIELIKEKFEILTPNYLKIYESNESILLLKNKNCGHTANYVIRNIIHDHVECSICNKRV